MSIENKKPKLCLSSESVANKISEKLNRVCELFDKLYNVNCGGCCYIAYCLAKLLHEDDIDYYVVVVSDDCEELPDCYFLSDIPCSCTHYGICIHDHYINMDEYDLESEYINHFSDVTPEEIKEYYLNGDWNECYDSDKNDFIFETLKNFYYDFTQDLREQ